MAKNVFYEIAEKYESGEWEWSKGIYHEKLHGKLHCCAIGALCTAVGVQPVDIMHISVSGDKYLTLIYNILREATGITDKRSVHCWNDDRKRTKEEIISAFKKAGELWGKQSKYWEKQYG